VVTLGLCRKVKLEKLAYWAFCFPEAQVITIRSGMVNEFQNLRYEAICWTPLEVRYILHDYPMWGAPDDPTALKCRQHAHLQYL